MEDLDCFFDDVYVKTHYGYLFDDDFGFSYISNGYNDDFIEDSFVLTESITYQNSKLNSEVNTSWTYNIIGSRSSTKEQSFISVDGFLSDAADYVNHDNIAKHLNKPERLFLKDEMDTYLPQVESTIFEDNMYKKIGTSEAIDHNMDVIYGENETKDDWQAESFALNLKKSRTSTPKKKLVYRNFFPELTENVKTETVDSAMSIYDWPYCRFCCKNGESFNVFKNHITKKVDGTVVCPVLRKYVCDMCGATGDKAHTRRYCPLYGEN